MQTVETIELPFDDEGLDRFIDCGEYTNIRRVEVMEQFLVRAARRFMSLRDFVNNAEDKNQAVSPERKRTLGFLYSQFYDQTADLRVFFTETEDFHQQSEEVRERLFKVADTLVGCGKLPVKLELAECLVREAGLNAAASAVTTAQSQMRSVVESARALINASSGMDNLSLERSALSRDVEVFLLNAKAIEVPLMSESGVDLTIEDWKAVLTDGLEMGNYWRPELIVHDIGEYDDDGLYYEDWNSRGEQAKGPFKSMDALVTDALRDNAVSEWRLVAACGLSAAKARKVMDVAEMIERREKSVEETPGP